MKTQNTIARQRGFTLMELMVAMAITTIIITILVSITSVALDAWNRSRAETRAARQAKTMVDTMSHDLESLVLRRGNSFEWLHAVSGERVGPASNKSPNGAKLTFLTAATDRYDGKVGTASDQGGDVSCVSYQLAYKDPIKGETSDNYSTFALYRLLVNPNDTFKDLLAQEDLDAKFTSKYSIAKVEELKNFVCENVYQFTITFNVVVEQTVNGKIVSKVVPITITESTGSNQVDKFSIKGTGLTYSGANNLDADLIASGRLSSLEISITVLSDAGLEQLRRRQFNGNDLAEFLAKNTYQYSKLVQLPSM